MTQKRVKDVGASVRQRLLNLSRQRGEDFQLTLIYYALERLMYRLSLSAYRDQFVLKGAILFSVWSESATPYRATRDLDLLGRGDNSVSRMQEVFREICSARVEDDGLDFAIHSMKGEEIRGGQEYEGVRLSFEARLGVARIPMQVDICFGDVIVPQVEVVDYPTLLDFPAPRVLSYPRDTVVAEKFHAMVILGIGNSRLKDFFDVWFLAKQFTFDGSQLSHAVRATFEQRRTTVPPEVPICLMPEFYEDRGKQVQWKAFLKKSGLQEKAAPLTDVIVLLKSFLVPPTTAISTEKPFELVWLAGGPWQSAAKGRATQ